MAVRTDGRPLGGAVDHSEEPRSVRRRLRAPVETPRCWSQAWGCRQSPRGPPCLTPLPSIAAGFQPALGLMLAVGFSFLSALPPAL